jgi:hypothetical protein
MGLRFHRSLKIAPGLRINLGLRGLTSLSVGGRGATLNLGKRGVKGTLSLPGTGLSYQHRFGRQPGSSSATQQVQSQPTVPPALTGVGRAIRPIAYLVIAAVLSGGYVASRHETPTEQANSGSVSSGSRATAAPTATTTAGAPNGSLAQRPTGPDAAAAEVGRGEAKNMVTATRAANVRAAPSMSGAVLRILPKGIPVQVLQSENGWLRVGERDGVEIGWVYGSLLK